jgi:4-hydroxybenzoate polyprenyltransferase
MGLATRRNSALTAAATGTTQSSWRRVAAVLGDIKIAHTMFALPFALLSAHLAFVWIGGYRWDTLVAILICMVTARTAAMSFNRYLDRDLDATNPRTRARSLPSGRARPVDALAVVIGCSVIFVAACWYLGPWPLGLSVPTLAFLLTYSISKRFTVMTHLWLGAALAIAPTGAWIAVTGGWSALPLLLSFAVACWVAGFDVIYALQDVDFDRVHRVLSAPATMGIPKALWSARTLHLLSFLALASFGVWAGIGWPYWLALSLVAALLVVEHSLVRADDFSRVGIAFFTVNGVISIVLYLSVLAATMAGALRLPGGAAP